MARLPNKLSDLIEVAIADLIKCERSSKYLVNMLVWHNPVNDEHCEVCFAGGVIAQTLSTDHKRWTEPCEFKTGINRKLQALDDLRRGRLGAALHQMNASRPYQAFQRKLDRHITPYSQNPGTFKREMRAFSRDMATAGL